MEIKHSHKTRRHRLVIALIVSCSIPVLVIPAIGNDNPKAKVWQDAPAEASKLLPNGYQPLPSLSNLVRKIKPAVFNVQSTQVIKPRQPRSHNPLLEDFFNRQSPFEFFFNTPQREQKRSSMGSGFFISADGYALTNHHVIANASEIEVILEDEHTFNAKVIGSDPETDVALLKVDSKKPLPFVLLGDSEPLQVGDWVVAIGNPFGFGHTVTAGIISGKERQLRNGPYDLFLQTDAAINPGNSGGPLFDTAGRVIGINTAIIAGGSGVGFAVPINIAKDLLPQLRTTGKVTRGWLGVGIQNLNEDLAEKFGVDIKAGVLVSQVYEDSPAEKAGFQAGDIVLSVGGKAVHDMVQLTTRIGAIEPNKKVRIVILRNKHKKTLVAKLGERKSGVAQIEGREASEKGGHQANKLGLTLRPLTKDIARKLGMPKGAKGLLVEEVDPSGPASEVVRRGDVLLEINRQPLSNVADLKKALAKSKKKGSILIRVQRGNSQIYLVIQH